jgi:TolB-like protein/DNA-binding winged helix-turn-helix (wHTH) protein
MIRDVSWRPDQSGDSRDSAGPGRHIRFGTFELDLRVGELRKSGVLVKLQHQPFKLLQILLESHGEVVSREELRRKLWSTGVYVDFDRSLGKAILKLRDALRDDAGSPRFIETLPRVGYRFIAQIETPDRQSEAPSGGGGESPFESAAPALGAPQIRSFPRGWRLGATIGIVAATLAILLCVGWIELRKKPQGQSTQITSLAVLQLENLSRDSAQEYLADGFTDDLTADLARIGAMRVTSRTSTIRFKGLKKSLAEIARELNVGAIVEGTVVRLDTRLRVTVHLIETSTDKYLWAGLAASTRQRFMYTLTKRIASPTILPQHIRHPCYGDAVVRNIYCDLSSDRFTDVEVPVGIGVAAQV